MCYFTLLNGIESTIESTEAQTFLRTKSKKRDFSF